MPQVFVVKSLAEAVGDLWRRLQNEHVGPFHVSSPLSSTPIPIYEWIIQHADSFSQWENFRFALMDEQLDGAGPYGYISLDDPASYERFARTKFLDPLSAKVGFEVDDILLKPDIEKLERFEIPIDLLILALGPKGNYANVMPGTPLETGWHIAQLIPEFRQAHTQQGSQSYEGAEFREYGMSLGPQQVLQAQNIVVIISGEKKKDLAWQLLSYKSFDPEFPLSIIHHPEVADKTKIFATPDVGVA